METIIYGKKKKKGETIKIKVPHVEEPIEAKVLDIIGYQTGGNSAHYECIMYAQNRIFRASYEFNWDIGVNYDENLDTSEEETELCEIHYYSSLKYEGIIVEYCEIPDIPLV